MTIMTVTLDNKWREKKYWGLSPIFGITSEQIKYYLQDSSQAQEIGHI